MTEEEKLNLLEQKATEFCLLGKRKGFRKDEIIKSACILACSEQMEKHYGDELKAMDKIIELCEQIDDEEKFIQEVCLLAGIE